MTEKVLYRIAVSFPHKVFQYIFNRHVYTRCSLACFGLGMASLLLVACNVTFADAALHERIFDKTPPALVLLTPLAGSSCANYVEVTGSVSDLTSSGGLGQVSRVFWEIPNTGLSSSSVLLDDEGTFSFIMDTSSLAGAFTVSIGAADWNDNTTIATLALNRVSGNSLPSFSVTAGNKSMALSWDHVPGTARYLVFYKTDGSIPDIESDEYIALPAAETSYHLEGLTNGNVCYVRLMAEAEVGSSSVSDYVRAVPLSPHTLCPVVTASATSLTVSWKPLSATDRYEVWRRTGNEGAFGLHAETSGSTFVDRNVEKETWYWYAIRPALEGSIRGNATAGMLDWFGVRPEVMQTISHGTMNTYGTLVAEGSRLYACTGSSTETSNGFAIFDITNPANPTFCAFMAIPAMDLVVDGTTLYVLAYESWYTQDGYVSNASLMIIDAEIPTAPVILSCLPLEDSSGDGVISVFGLAKAEDEIWIPAVSDGIKIIDVSDPDAPFISGSIGAEGDRYVSVCMYDGYAYATVLDGGSFNECSLLSFNISSRSLASTLVSTDIWPSGTDIFRWPAVEMVVEHSAWSFNEPSSYPILWVRDNEAGIRLFNVGIPGHPQYRTTIDTPGIPADFVYDGRAVYIADKQGGLQICRPDANNSYDMALDRNLAVTLPGETGGVAQAGGYVYASTFPGAIELVNLGIPVPVGDTNLVPREEYGYQGYQGAFGTMVRYGPWVYVPVHHSLIITDLSITDDSATSTSVPLGDTAWFMELCVSGGTLFANENGDLVALDLADPLNPVLLGRLELNADITMLHAEGPWLYCGTKSKGLYVIDISDPENMSNEATLLASDIRKMVISGDLAHVLGSGGLTSIDISSPVKPSILQTMVYQSDALSSRSLSLYDNYLYACDFYQGIYIYPLDSRGLPQIPAGPFNDVGYQSSFSYVTDITLSGNWALVTSAMNHKTLWNISDRSNPVFHGELEANCEEWSTDEGLCELVGRTLITVDADGLKRIRLAGDQ